MEEEEKKETEVGLGTLYDMNKAIVEKEEKTLSQYALNRKKEVVTQFITETNNQYYMLLSNERKDYTIFRITDKEELSKKEELSSILVDECLLNRGDTKGIDITQDKGAIEIWISIDGESYVYYFFPYDLALVEI